VDETRAETVVRRLRTIHLRVLAFVLATPLLPGLLGVGLVMDAVRLATSRVRPTAWRLVVFMWVYLAAEVVGLAVLWVLWVASLGGRRRSFLLDATWHVQQYWAAALFGAAMSVFRLRLEVAGSDAVERGPLIVLIRHASILDTLLPANLVSRPYGIRLRYVLKRELLADPCLDVAGQRLPNYFVRRGTGEAQEVERVRSLARDLSPEDGVLIYPEGTRFTPARRAKEITRIAKRDPRLAAHARLLRHLLPPRLGGVKALLDGAPDADLAVIAHHGLDGLRSISDIWRGGLVGLLLEVRITRVPRSEVPEGDAARADWLYGVWHDMDNWLEERFRGPTSAPV
jgi:1-acyl-sn-glycerol-3-phosphate acyltransferase